MRRVPSTRSAGSTAGFCASCGQALAQTSTGGGRSGRGKLPSHRRFQSLKGTPTSPSSEATLGSRTDSGRVASGFTSAAHRRTWSTRARTSRRTAASTSRRLWTSRGHRFACRVAWRSFAHRTARLGGAAASKVLDAPVPHQ
ncbi:hypothetical protein M885DRAFT_621920 [Pelagophyceae sp. CCMP2097]|nr:hypothetical protein M885DRAFT_621920 [Pelagophyceae sp. CCMP2097]